MPGTTSTALPSFSHDQHQGTDADKQKGGFKSQNGANSLYAKSVELKLFYTTKS